MNIFFLSKNPTECAQWHVNRHVVKMILELAQLLSTAHHMLNSTIEAYKPTHINHPCALWVRSSTAHYKYTYTLFVELSHEYKYRYNKEHLSYIKLNEKLKNPPASLTNNEWIDPPCAMPKEYIIEGDAIASYRNYYIQGKKHLHTYTKREIPSWLIVAE